MIDEVRKTALATLALIGNKTAAKILAIAVLLSICDLAGIATVIPFVKLLVTPEKSAYLPLSFVALFGGSGVALDCGLLAVFLAVFAVKFLLQYKLVAAQAVILSDINARVTDDLVTKFLGARFSVFQRNSASELAGVCYSNPVHVTIVIAALSSLASEIFFITAIFLALGFIYPAVTFGLFAVTLAVVYMLLQTAIRPAQSLGVAQRRLEAQRHGLFFAVAGSIREIAVMDLQHVFNTRSAAISSQLAGISGTYQALSFAPRIMIEFLFISAVLALVAAFVILQIKVDDMVPAMTAFLVASIRMTPAVSRTLSAYTNLRFSGTFVSHLTEVRDRLTAAQRPSIPDELSFKTSLRLEDVAFRYEDQDVLRGVTLDIPKGACVGIVGRSGEGKSTLLDLLVGLQPVTAGRFLCDGQPFDPFSSGSFRHIIGYVPQSVSLYADTLAFNVALEELPNETRLRDAIRMAGLAEFVSSLPDGFETNLGENGIRVSGGQRQRLGIARALYRSPQVLVLDEATSALDSVTEANLTKEIEGLKQQVTIILVAHRISTVTRCDRIYLLDGGMVAEQGHHDELLALGGLYAGLVAAGGADLRTQDLNGTAPADRATA